MLVGVPAEWKADEYRVALTPDKVETLVHEGHPVLLETGAGAGAGFADSTYHRVGARLTGDHSEVFGADLVVKVKEPQPEEYGMLHPGLALFTYLHLAAQVELTDELLARRVTGIAYETIQEPGGGLPLLSPMSEIAGRLSPQIAAYHLQSTLGGPGKLLGGVPGVWPATVVVLGGGNVGANAALIALGMGARVIVMDLRVDRLGELHATHHGNLQTVLSNRANVDAALREADVVIGAVLVPGAAAPKLVTRAMLADIREGCVMIDVAIDQGGCFETSRPTTHHEPTYTIDGVIHYAVANIPSMVAHTASLALSNVTFPYIRRLVSRGVEGAIESDRVLASGVNTHGGRLVHPAVAQAQGRPYVPVEQASGQGEAPGSGPSGTIR